MKGKRLACVVVGVLGVAALGFFVLRKITNGFGLSRHIERHMKEATNLPSLRAWAQDAVAEFPNMDIPEERLPASLRDLKHNTDVGRVDAWTRPGYVCVVYTGVFERVAVAVGNDDAITKELGASRDRDTEGGDLKRLGDGIWLHHMGAPR